MEAAGTALIVGGMAFLFSGLIFLIPVRGRNRESEQVFPAEPFEGRLDQVERHLRDMRRTRGEVDR
jgi:hypothetical protein